MEHLFKVEGEAPELTLFDKLFVIASLAASKFFVCKESLHFCPQFPLLGIKKLSIDHFPEKRSTVGLLALYTSSNSDHELAAP